MHLRQTDLANIHLKIQLMEKSLSEMDRRNLYRFECLFHDVPLILESAESHFIHYLESYIPKSWQLRLKSGLQIICLHTTHFEFENFVSYEVYEQGQYIIQRDFIAKVENGIVYLLFNQNLSSFPDGFHNSMRWILFDRFIDFQKVCLHSSIVIDKDLAYVFLGHSGAGKSTTTQLSLPRIHLGDDMNVISFDPANDRYFAEAALLGQAYKIDGVRGLKFTIQGFYWLNQSNRHELTRMSKAEALSKLLQSIPNVKPDNFRAERVLNFCKQLSDRYPMFQLNFCRDSHFWEKIYAQDL